MQFIVEHQAQRAAHTDSLAERVDSLAERVKEHDERLLKLETSVATVTDLVGRLAQAEIRLVEHMNGLAEAQKDTEVRLNIFIAVVEKHIESHGNGRSTE